LQHAIVARQEEYVAAASGDFGGRAREETLALELVPLVDEIRLTRRHLPRWMRPRVVGANLAFFPARARVMHQPLGVVGIIGAWNYPAYLTLGPLIGALAAGNHAVIKPSELAPQSAAWVASLVAGIFPEDYVAVVQGGPDAAAAFSALLFDHLLFTGSARVGKLVMRAASENLTPVTLELGGKSPAIVHQDYPLRTAAERILAGKLYNAGQTCIAPDYLLLHERRCAEFLRLAEEIVRRQYPSLAANPDYTRIINPGHYQRLAAMVQEARESGAAVHTLNPANETLQAEARTFPPTIVLGAPDSSRLLREEIFGPILPVVPYRDLQEAIDYINARPRPLALYYFDDDSARVRRILQATTSGGAVVNDVLFHIAQHNLPFGGVGPSGMGHYHGFAGFETFSKKKGVLLQSRFSAMSFLRPPFSNTARRIIRFMLRS
jgi:coniferyl-aldehyde dehydrogenase